ncbi:MAG: aminotransferase class I/II-fold pyridoxal phosphate-dependent enzyme [Clostridia bacterium]|nr:aminotransferase class I/II-fold pyridoxal phosphate-dependent enzyme [Clostridia bacterium]
MSKLAVSGGEPLLKKFDLPEEMFRWPIQNKESEDAVIDVLRTNRISGNDVTIRFENEFAGWIGAKHAVCATNGTMALEAAFFAAGIKAGDEVICPTKTYWASCLSAQKLGAAVVFANVDPDTVCLDPNDLERCLSPWTKAIVVVHYRAHPCDMDGICAFAKKHGLKIIEDVSHAQGGLYKGKRLGTFGDVAAMSLMSQKSFSAGELGVLVTSDDEAHERALAYLHYERNNEKNITDENLLPYINMPLGAMKGRANQMCAALARVQLKYYDERTAEIRRALNYFWDALEGCPGVHGIRVDESDGSNMAGWYVPHFVYRPEEIDGISFTAFCEAVSAEIGWNVPMGGNFPLHTHPVFQTFDPMGLGKPARIAFAHRDVRELDKALAPSEGILCAEVPYFKKYIPAEIDKIANGFLKVIENHSELIGKKGEDELPKGQWYGKVNKDD